MISKPQAPPPSMILDTNTSRTFQTPEKRNGHSPTTVELKPNVDAPTVKRSRWGWLITLGFLAGAGAAGWYYQAAWLPRVMGMLSSGGPPAKPPARPIPVVTAVVKKRNMDLFLNGLGTVTALKTVTMRSRVEGELINIAFAEGQMVHEGQLIAEIDTRPFMVQRDQAAGQLARDKATLDIANLNLNRLNKLLASKAVNQQMVDEQVALVKQTEGMIKSDDAMIASAELQLTYCKIVAPVTGRIGLRLVDVGNYVRANDPNGLAVITQLEPIALVFTIPQDDIPRVQKRMREGHVLTVDAYDRDFQFKIATGVLKAIDNQVDPTTGTLKLKAQFDKNDNVLFPNQFVNTRLLVDTRRNAVVVPSAAVQRGPSSTFVYLVKPDETVDLQNVVIGPTEGAETCIESGLSPGDIVVTDGIDKLQPKSKITTREKKAGEGKGEKEKGKGESSPSDTAPSNPAGAQRGKKPAAEQLDQITPDSIQAAKADEPGKPETPATPNSEKGKPDAPKSGGSTERSKETP
ncbi:MAG: mdtA 2 [Planctomycetaceae bacterium]|nr:mdtA 2 [Planctomycetaceae bacterium]